MICGWLNAWMKTMDIEETLTQRANCKVIDGFLTVQMVGDPNPTLSKCQVDFV